MIYNNADVRRQDRLLDDSKAITLLKNGEYGILSMFTEDNIPYGIPINYVWDGMDSIYFHCAPEGKKLKCIDLCPNVSFCVVGKTNVVSHQFTTGYESIVIKGIINANIDADECMTALKLLLDKYSPNDKVTGIKYAEKSFHRTAILRLDISEFSGKAKLV